MPEQLFLIVLPLERGTLTDPAANAIIISQNTVFCKQVRLVFLLKRNNLPAKLRVGWRSYGSEGVEEVIQIRRDMITKSVPTVGLFNVAHTAIYEHIKPRRILISAGGF